MIPSDPTPPRPAPLELASLGPLARQFPTVDAALAEITRLTAELPLPKGTVHVLSDVHGEHAKLRHIINNASGTLRPRVERLFAAELSPDQLQQFLALLFYPRETLEQAEATVAGEADRRDYCRRTLRCLFTLIGALTEDFGFGRVQGLLPADFRDLFQEILARPSPARIAHHVEACLDVLGRHRRAFHLIRLAARLARNLAVEELVLGGDFWDRGPRGDLVLDYLMRQPNVAITWGNHDAAWFGACLGQEALIAHVLRISLRYRRLSQLEEGYGINLQPLELLARTVYGTDLAACFQPRGTGLRETIQMARMQKAAAVLQFKLEGQTIARNPEFDLEGRRLLHRIDQGAGTVAIDGQTYPLRDSHFPTLDPADPYRLSVEERACLARVKQSFLNSRKLWEHMRFLVGRGSMYLCRDDHLLFHGCVPVDERGEFLAFEVDGRPRRGRALFDALDRAVVGTLERPTDKGRDLLWYLWCGPRSPLFGKDRIATFEIDLVADQRTHVETKDPYFRLIHEADFCERVLAEFGADPRRGLIVNGHVPVQIDKGESPLKRSGKAITIDGAFSAAYGDHGYTLVLEPGGTFLARHHRFESVEAAVRQGVDIIPAVTEIRRWEPPRRVADTERGVEIRAQIQLLERLVAAYRANHLRQR
jgi:fructose-1,6-bisphosphatase-3